MHRLQTANEVIMRTYWNFPKVTQPRLPKDLKTPAWAQQI